MIRFKPSVRFNTYSPALRYILEVLDELNRQQIPDYPKDWVVTSVNDSKHKTDSKHYKDMALDLRSHNFKSLFIKQQFANRLEMALGPKFSVLLESINASNEHFHIQVKKGEIYP